MSTLTPEAQHAAEHFITRNARLIDRHRFAFHFQSGPTGPIHSALDAYRNVDGGYGNGLDPDARGHPSQPVSVSWALHLLDELGPIPASEGGRLCHYLTSVIHPNGGVPPVLPTIRHTEAAPWYRERTDFSGALDPTAAIAALMHKHHISDQWRDRATAFCWTRLDMLRWTHPNEAIAICDFLQHAANHRRAAATFDRIAPMIRAVVELDPGASGHVHKPLDIATHPDHIARRLFTDAEIDKHLEALIERQADDGGWDCTWQGWAEHATLEWRGIITLRTLDTLRAYGRVDGHLPTPLREG